MFQGRSHTPAPADGWSIIRTARVNASKTTGSLVSVRNPENVGIWAALTGIRIQTPSNVACDVDVGIAATDILSDNLIDGAGMNMPANTVYNNITDVGANGKSRQYVGPGQYFTAYVASGNANGLVADFMFDYKMFQGGNP